jgi:hypothetical protein
VLAEPRKKCIRVNEPMFNGINLSFTEYILMFSYRVPHRHKEDRNILLHD